MADQPDIESMRIVAPDAGELERAAEAALRPKKLSEFVGQRVVRGQLQLVLDAARMRSATPTTCSWPAPRDWARRHSP